MQQARALQDARRIYSLDYSSRCSNRLFVTFNIATIVCDGSNTPVQKEGKRMGVQVRGKKIWISK